VGAPTSASLRYVSLRRGCPWEKGHGPSRTTIFWSFCHVQLGGLFPLSYTSICLSQTLLRRLSHLLFTLCSLSTRYQAAGIKARRNGQAGKASARDCSDEDDDRCHRDSWALPSTIGKDLANAVGLVGR
jgi:hypothetical protein